MVSPADLVASAWISGRAGLLAPARPSRALAMGRALRHWGPTLAGGFAVAAARFPDRVAVVDETRALTFRSLHERSNAQANALRVRGIADGSKVGVLCRNHAGFVEATAALAKIGADAVLCNTGFGATQLADVLEREHVLAIVHDEEFGPVVHKAAPNLPAYLAWHGGSPEVETLDDLAQTGDPSDSPRPVGAGRTTILTSGTTGTPKGAPAISAAGSRRESRCCPRCRCASATCASSAHRCSTHGASGTSRSARSWGRRPSFADASTRWTRSRPWPTTERRDSSRCR